MTRVNPRASRPGRRAEGAHIVGADAEYAHTPFALAEEQFLQAAERVGALVSPSIGAC